MIAAKCPCGTMCQAPDDAVGKRGKCPRCDASFTIAPLVLCPACGSDVMPDSDARFSCGCPPEKRRRHVFTGPPGSVWINSSQRIVYQLQPAFHEECGVCFRWSQQIGPFWPIPIRRGCVCSQRPIHPGEKSLPFVDLDHELSRVTIEQRDLLFGRHNRCLLDAGLVHWRDLLGRLTIIEFEHVVFNSGLSLESILAAGVPEIEAHAAYGRVSARRRDAEKNRQMLRKLKDAGFTIEIERQ